MSEQYQCPECGFTITVSEDSGTWFCEGDSWEGVDRGHHPKTEMNKKSGWL